jgi:hypothetical protein
MRPLMSWLTLLFLCQLLAAAADGQRDDAAGALEEAAIRQFWADLDERWLEGDAEPFSALFRKHGRT